MRIPVPQTSFFSGFFTTGCLALAIASGTSGCNTGGLSGGGGGGGFVLPDLHMNVPVPDMAHGGDIVDPGIVSKSNKSIEEAETHVATAGNGYVAVAYIGLSNGGSATNGYRFSTDDGTTFLPAASLNSPGGRTSSDPVLATDAKNNFYMTWIGYKYGAQGKPVDMHVYAAQAPAGTTTFGTPVEVSNNPNGSDEYDKPWITVENDGSVLITYARTSTGGIFAARSTDFATWDNQVIAEDNSFRNLVFPCHPSTGTRIYVVYATGRGIGLRWSEDSGTTWLDANKTSLPDPNEGMPAFDDPTCVAEGMEVWGTYGLTSDQMGNNGMQSAKLDTIRIAHSGDGGKTIDVRHDASDPNAGAYYLHPYLVRESNGALDIAYYAGQMDMDKAGSFRWGRSTDGGATWSASVTVKKPLTFTGARASQIWLGDYAGLAFARDNVYMSYVNNTGAVSHVSFYRAPTIP